MAIHPINTVTKAENINLSFTQGSSDKVYKAALIEEGDGYLVNFAYGRRGKPLRNGTKTPEPVSYKKAKTAYDNLVNSKKAKGYTEDGSGEPFRGSQIDSKRTGWLPQLLNPIEKENLSEVLERFQGWVALQYKHDGERRIVIAENGKITGSNRRGLAVDIHENCKQAVNDILEFHCIDHLVLDTEDMGTHLVIFDVLEFGNRCVLEDPFQHRSMFLQRISESLDESDSWVDIPVFVNKVEGIERFIDRAEKLNEEGIVLRDPSDRYNPGRPNSWGPCLKLKFYATATCVVASRHETKRSVNLMLLDNNEEAVSVGNCTIPPNYELPVPGDLVEVKYLYAYRGGSLYQPQYKGVRTDLDIAAANTNQLKFKDESDD